MDRANYLSGALYKARLDLIAKEYENARNGMRISFDLSLDEIDCLLRALKAYAIPLEGCEQNGQKRSDWDIKEE